MRRIDATSTDDTGAALLTVQQTVQEAARLGIPVSEGTIRLYLTEGILPPPLERDGEPAYSATWILTVLQVIDCMRNRLGRGLAEVRTVIAGLEEDPEILLHKLRTIDEEYLRPAREDGDGPLDAEAARVLADCFFMALAGKDGSRRQPSSVSILDLAAEVGAAEAAQAAPKEGPRTSPAPPPLPEEDLASEPEAAHDRVPAGLAEAAAEGSATDALFDDGDSLAELEPDPVPIDFRSPPPARADEPAPAAPPGAAAPTSGRGGVRAEQARALEELFIGRFDDTMARVCRIPHPIEETLYPAGPRDRIHLKRTRSDEVIDHMKRHRVYDRDLLDVLPLDEVSEYRVFTRSIFGRKDVRVVLAACSVSPLEDLIVHRSSSRKAGPADLERALEAVSPREGAFYYLGVLSTTGWEAGIERHLPSAPNVLCCVAENEGGSEWLLRHSGDDRWSGLERIFDPESEREKIERLKRKILAEPELALRGGHILLKTLRESLGVSRQVLAAAVLEVVRQDPDLSVEMVGGREIIKRRRI